MNTMTCLFLYMLLSTAATSLYLKICALAAPDSSDARANLMARSPGERRRRPLPPPVPDLFSDYG